MKKASFTQKPGNSLGMDCPDVYVRFLTAVIKFRGLKALKPLEIEFRAVLINNCTPIARRMWRKKMYEVESERTINIEICTHVQVM